MNVRRAGRQATRTYGSLIERITGGSLDHVRFRPSGKVEVADASAQTGIVRVNPAYFAGTNRKDLMGALIHELTHVASDSGFGGGEREEVAADAVRFALLGNKGGWQASDEARRMANKKGWTDMAGPQLPGLGKTGGRLRNTLANLQSHNKTVVGGPNGPTSAAHAAPQLSPGETAAYYAQMQGLYQQYELQRAQLKQQRVGLRAGLREQVAGIRAEKVAALSGVENEAIERGVLGSSAELANRAGVRGEAAGAIAGAKRDMRMGLAESRLGDQQAAIGLYQGLSQLEAEKAARQQDLLAQQLQNNLIISGQESTMDILRRMYRAQMGGGGGGGGAADDDPRATDPRWRRRVTPNGTVQYVHPEYGIRTAPSVRAGGKG